jgi:LPS-assembly protein
MITFVFTHHMNTGRKVSPKNYLLWIVLLLISSITTFATSNYTNRIIFYNTLTSLQSTTDTVPARTDSIPGVRDSTIRPAQEIDTIGVRISKDSLDAPVTYTASDSMVLDIPTKKIRLYNQGNVKYKDLDLSAHNIELDQEKQIVVAKHITDSTGKMVGKPKFVQGENNMESDEITYNIKSQKGVTKSTYTSQGEMFVFANQLKKFSEDEYFGLGARITTCDLDTPHFHFKTGKMKLVNRKLAVSGPIHPEFEGVPVPIYLPFGFFPLSQGRHSGILQPTFTANEQFGLGLEGMGYYKVLNDNFDVRLQGDIYSYGGYRLNLSPTYRVRYRYAGQMNLAFQKTRFLASIGTKEYETNRSFNIQWSHQVDSKARPGTSFSANVNAGSTQFNRFVANDPNINFRNQLSSSIYYSKNWGTSMNPNAYNMTVSANHTQNDITREVILGLPNINFTATTIYPFQPKDMVGEGKWYQKLGIGLNSNIAGRSSFYDSLFSVPELIDAFQWGAQHSIPITLSLPALGPFTIAPGVSFQERWHAQKFTRTWNAAKYKVDTTVEKGFFARRDLSFSLGINTAIFGTFDRFGKNSRVKAIRHVIRPSFSINYKPDMAKGDFYDIQVDTSRLPDGKVGNRYRFSYFDGSMFGSFSEGRFGGIGFGFDNNLEMKVRSKTDTAQEADKKIKLIDGFGFNGSYNLMAKEFALSSINMYMRSTLFEKINITANATLDPYKTNRNGFRVNTYAWSPGEGNWGGITNGNIAISTSFQSKQKEERKEPTDDERNQMGNPLTLEEQQSQMDYIRNHPGEFADFNIPWSVSLSYSLSFNKQFTRQYKFETQVNSTLSMNGDFNLTPKWKTGMNAYYDFRTSSIQSLTMFLSREMHCWQMSINVTPVGLYRSFNITISPKSGLLRDLKINRSRYFYGG